VYQISSESPEFCRRNYKKKQFGLIFLGHTVYNKNQRLMLVTTDDYWQLTANVNSVL